MRNLLSTLVAVAMVHTGVHAQEDNGFPNPPPGEGGSGGEKAAPGESGLSADKKKKFAEASPEDITNENFPDLIESFDYPNAEITDVIKAMSELTGKNFIIDPGVRGKITIIAPSRITVAEAYKAFLSALAINGYTVVPSGKFLKVKSARNAQRDSIETYSGNYYPNSDQMITRIIHLKHIMAEQVNRDLRILASKDGEMSVYPPTNSIILSDFGSNIERVMRIINQLDVPGFEEQINVIPIKHAKSKDLADIIDQIVNKGERSNRNGGRAGSFTAGVPRFSRTGTGTGSQTNASFMVIPDDRTNALIVVGNTAGINRIKKLISQLDFKIRPEDQGGVYVYYVKHGEAEKIATTLNGIAKDAAPKPATGGGPAGPIGVLPAQQASQEIFGGEIKIGFDKHTNSLIITASKQDYEVVTNLLSKIDIPRDQVYVEAIIMEMQLTDSQNWGIGYYNFDSASKGVGRQGFNGLGNLTDFLDPTKSPQGAVLGFANGGDVALSPLGAAAGATGAAATTGSITVKTLTGFISFLKSIGKANILSTPQIMAIDNEEAEIEVGDRVATGLTTTQANGGTAQSTNFEDATIKLKIKPFISPSTNAVRLEIDQKISQPSTKQTAAKGLADVSVQLTKRSIKTNVNVTSGDTAVLGGLMSDQETEIITKVPILGDIPIIGWLFKGKQTKLDKVNLLVFLTPKIIRNNEDSSNLLSKKLDERLNYIKQSGGRDPHGDFVNSLPRTAKADVEPAPIKKNAPTEAPANEAKPEAEDAFAPEGLIEEPTSTN